MNRWVRDNRGQRPSVLPPTDARDIGRPHRYHSVGNVTATLGAKLKLNSARHLVSFAFAIAALSIGLAAPLADPPAEFVLGDSSSVDGCGEVSVTIDIKYTGLSGLQMAICPEEGIGVTAIGMAESLPDDAWAVARVVEGGAVLGLLTYPDGSQTMARAEGVRIATVTVCCDSPPEGDSDVFALTFCEDGLGDPNIPNLTSSTGYPADPDALVLHDSEFTCLPWITVADPDPDPDPDADAGGDVVVADVSDADAEVTDDADAIALDTDAVDLSEEVDSGESPDESSDETEEADTTEEPDMVEEPDQRDEPDMVGSDGAGDDASEDIALEVAIPDTGSTTDPVSESDDAEGCGCSSSAGTSQGGWVVLLACLVLVLPRRRRKTLALAVLTLVTVFSASASARPAYDVRVGDAEVNLDGDVVVPVSVHSYVTESGFYGLDLTLGVSAADVVLATDITPTDVVVELNGGRGPIMVESELDPCGDGTQIALRARFTSEATAAFGGGTHHLFDLTLRGVGVGEAEVSSVTAVETSCADPGVATRVLPVGNSAQIPYFEGADISVVPYLLEIESLESDPDRSARGSIYLTVPEGYPVSGFQLTAESSNTEVATVSSLRTGDALETVNDGGRPAESTVGRPSCDTNQYYADITFDNTVEIDQVLDTGRHHILDLIVRPVSVGEATIGIDRTPCDGAVDFAIWSRETSYDALVVGGAFDSHETYIRGDVYEDDSVSVSDVDKLIQIIHNEDSSWCWALGDVNDDSFVNVADAVYLFNFLFKEGPAPAEPFAEPASEFVCEPF